MGNETFAEIEVNLLKFLFFFVNNTVAAATIEVPNKEYFIASPIAKAYTRSYYLFDT